VHVVERDPVLVLRAALRSKIGQQLSRVRLHGLPKGWRDRLCRDEANHLDTGEAERPDSVPSQDSLPSAQPAAAAVGTVAREVAANRR
jgi:hypothetical protein